MEQLVRTTLNLEQYQCRRCGRFFYVNRLDRGELDLDFGCPFGCDDNGLHTRDLRTEVSKVTEVSAHESG